MKNIVVLAVLLALRTSSFAQLPDSCKLVIGTNLGGVSDYGTEIPFVNLMHVARTWYSKDDTPDWWAPFDSQTADSMTYRPDGYPTHIPQTVPGHVFRQKVATIWAVTDGWKSGDYVVLFDGAGSLRFNLGLTNLVQTGPNRYTFTVENPVGGILEMVIDSSAAADPVRNIRVLPAAHETTYDAQPFNPVWLDKMLAFKSVRFMDWGQTNSWGQSISWDWDDPTLFGWNERAQMDHYTWANEKGIPYEMMIRLMNDYDLDGWVCVPHRAGNDYIQNMAGMFKNNLEPERHLTVEYSNEIWNWIFGQAQWCLKYGQIATGVSWPECTVPYIQNCLDQWTSVYGADVHRITRTVGVQTAWQDVSNRIVYNLTPGTYDAFSPAYYFGLGEQSDAILDALGISATAADVVFQARQSRNNEMQWLLDQKHSIADSLHIPMLFYEGGQHLTPNPFGQMPAYAQALLDVQRDTAMYNLYNEWYNFLRTLQSGNEPLQLMNFSLIGARSAQYGSWGLLETMDQDLDAVPAPKYRATLENMAKGDCAATTGTETGPAPGYIKVFPNPFQDVLQVESAADPIRLLQIYNATGIRMRQMQPDQSAFSIDVSTLPGGVYMVRTIDSGHRTATYKLIKQ